MEATHRLRCEASFGEPLEVDILRPTNGTANRKITKAPTIPPSESWERLRDAHAIAIASARGSIAPRRSRSSSWCQTASFDVPSASRAADGKRIEHGRRELARVRVRTAGTYEAMTIGLPVGPRSNVAEQGLWANDDAPLTQQTPRGLEADSPSATMTRTRVRPRRSRALPTLDGARWGGVTLNRECSGRWPGVEGCGSEGQKIRTVAFFGWASATSHCRRR